VTDNVEYLARQLTDVIRGRGSVLDDPPREREILGHLILHGMDTPERCGRCGQRPPRVGRTFCETCLEEGT
jgi:hypothetical protein